MDGTEETGRDETERRGRDGGDGRRGRDGGDGMEEMAKR